MQSHIVSQTNTKCNWSHNVPNFTGLQPSHWACFPPLSCSMYTNVWVSVWISQAAHQMSPSQQHNKQHPFAVKLSKHDVFCHLKSIRSLGNSKPTPLLWVIDQHISVMRKFKQQKSWHTRIQSITCLRSVGASLTVAAQQWHIRSLMMAAEQPQMRKANHEPTTSPKKS